MIKLCSLYYLNMILSSNFSHLNFNKKILFSYNSYTNLGRILKPEKKIS